MRNNKLKLSRTILEQIESLPYFTLDDLAYLDKNRNYLKIILCRAVKRKTLVRLKKGYYASRVYLESLEKKNTYSDYLEFVANTIYQPSYLSFEYILAAHGALTESPKKITSASMRKTAYFRNELGDYFYHHLKPALFTGFEIINAGGFMIARATRAKALFDFLYMRKNILSDAKSIEELRLNLEVFSVSDRREIKKYVEIEGSKKMKEIYNLIFPK